MTPTPTPPPGITCDNFPPACLTDISLLGNILLPLVYVGAALLLLGMFFYAGFVYIQAQGDANKVKEAQQTISYAVLGIIVIAVAYFLVRIVSFILGIEFIL